MPNGPSTRLALAAILLVTLLSPRQAYAQLGLGTWTRSDTAASGPGLAMTVEACCNGGRRIVYRVEGQAAIMMSIDSPMNGTEAPVMIGGKPSGETMAIKLVDPLHMVTVIKMNGQPFATSKATISADGKTLTVENDATGGPPGQTPGNTTEKWSLRK